VATTRFGRRHLLGRAVDYASFYLTCAIELLRRVGRGDVVVAKTDPPLLSLLAAPIARLKGAKLVNWQQDVFPEVASRLDANPLPAWLDGWLRRRRDDSLRAARMNVLVGERMREYFAARGLPVDRLCVLENWVDAAAISPKPSAESELRCRLGLRDEFVVCYSGNFGRAHEYEGLLGAIETLKDDASVAFLFIGGGARMEALQSAVASRGLSRVRFLPYQPRAVLNDSLAAGDVHLASLIPSLEGFIVPSKFYGILAAGRPVIFVGDPDGELPRLIREHGCGVTVSAGDAPALVAGIRALQADGDQRAAMGRAARQLSARYSTVQGIERWAALLAAL
jgi:glycosyltransferase involved in cell wall biosynthesis